MSSILPNKHLVGLDALRGIAAIVVLLHHIDGSFKLNMGFRHGYLSVDIFFVLSGFVIASAYEAKLAAGMSLIEYGFIRWARLFPVIFLGICLGFLAYVLGFGEHNVSQSDILSAFIFQCIFVPTIWTRSNIFLLDPVQWSLFVEAVVNFVHAAGVKWITTRRLLFVFACLTLALVAAAWKYKSLSVGWEAYSLPGGVVRGAFGFSAGLLIYRFEQMHHARRSSFLWPIAVAALPLMVLVRSYLHIDTLWWADLPFVIFLTPAIVFVGLRSEFPKFLIKPALLLGTLSYPLYAVQQPLIMFYKGFYRSFDLHIPSPVSGLVVFIFTCVFASLCIFIYDRPVSILLKQAQARVFPLRSEGATTPNHQG